MLSKWKGISDNAEHVYRHCSEDALRFLSPTAILGGRYLDLCTHTINNFQIRILGLREDQSFGQEQVVSKCHVLVYTQSLAFITSGAVL